MKSKNKLKFLFLVFVIFLCVGCDGNVTRDLRHDGFAYGSEFKCNFFYPQDKEDTSYKKIQHLLGGQVIDTEGKIYEISLGQAYANNSNCKQADTTIRVKGIMDGSIVRAEDGKFYYLQANTNGVAAYTEVPNTDNNYYIYEMLLKDEGVIKVVTVDSSTGLYYALKNDGNVYGITITKADRNSPAQVSSTVVVYNQVDYGGAITDFNYAGNSGSTYIKTNTAFYKMYTTNGDQCSKYADVQCTYEMRKSETLNEYRDRIIAYNGSTLITDYNRVFTITN